MQRSAMSLNWRRSSLILSCALLSACPGGSAPPGARYTFTSEGTGTTNAELLNPLRDGTYRGGFLVDGTVDLPTGRARRVVEDKGVVTYVIDTNVGLFIAGGTADRVLENPVLSVPATVRVGMTWEVTVGASAKPTYTFEVTSRIPGRSQFGDTVQWSIDQTDSKGRVTTREYAEGFGISTSSGDTVILPLDTPDPEPMKAPIVAIEPLPGTAGVASRQAVTSTSISMVRAPGHDALLMYDNVAMGGTAAECWRLNTEGGGPVMPVTGLPYVHLGPDTCPAMSTPQTMFSQGLIISAHANGAFVSPSGTITWMPRHRGLSVPSNLGQVKPAAGLIFTSRVLIQGDDGGVDLVRPSGAVVKISGFAYVDGQFSVPDGEVFVPDTWLRLAPNDSFISPIATDEGDRQTVLARGRDDMLWLSRISRTGMTVPEQVGRLGGTLSVQTTERGSEILRVAGDGQVDRLHVSAGKLTLEPLADVEVPPGTSVDAAFLLRDPAGDRLIVALLTSDLEDGLKLYRSVAPVVASAVRRAMTPHVWTNPEGGNFDKQVCLPAGDEGVTTQGWTLGGAPAGVAVEISPGRRCLLLVRGPGQPVRQAGSVFDAATGSFPGYGRVFVADGLGLAFGAGTGLADDAPHVLAPLRGGGVAHASRKYGRGLVAIEPVTLTPTPTTGPIYGPILNMWVQVPLIDVNGDGFWALRNAFNPDGIDVMRIGRTLARKTIEGGIEIHAVSQKGGVLALMHRRVAPYAWTRLTSDGAEVVLTQPPSGLTHYCAELRDGTLCGDVFEPTVSMVRHIACIAPGGATRTALPLTDPVSGSELWCSGSTALSDGSLLLLGDSGMFRFDTTTMTAAPYLAARPWLGIGSDGSVWGVTVDDGGTIALYRMLPTGPQLVATPVSYKVSAVSHKYTVTVDDDVIGVVSASPALVMVRISRPGP